MIGPGRNKKRPLSFYMASGLNDLINLLCEQITRKKQRLCYLAVPGINKVKLFSGDICKPVYKFYIRGRSVCHMEPREES